MFTRDIVDWWQPNALFQFTPRSPGRLQFEPPGEGRDGRLTEHRGWDTVPTSHVAKHGFPEDVFLRRHGEWWRGLLEAFARQAQTQGN